MELVILLFDVTFATSDDVEVIGCPITPELCTEVCCKLIEFAIEVDVLSGKKTLRNFFFNLNYLNVFKKNSITYLLLWWLL